MLDCMCRWNKCVWYGGDGDEMRIKLRMFGSLFVLFH